MKSATCRNVLIYGLLAGLGLGAGLGYARATVIDDFENPQLAWVAGDADAAYRLVRHQHLEGQAHSGQGSELIQIAAEMGTHIDVVHPVVAARIIDELKSSVWIKADRPGMQFMARIVLPHTLDPKTRRPSTVYVAGSSYKSVGAWEQLSIGNLPLLLSRQTWTLQAKMGPTVDVREAYVDQLVLNVYGGTGETAVDIDDLEIMGVVPRNQNFAPPGVAAGQVSQIQPAAAIDDPGGGASPLNKVISAAGSPAYDPKNRAARDVSLSGSTLMVSGRPTLPRIIEYRGEPLALLKNLGFNIVHTQAEITQPLLNEAQQTGMRLIGPPPPLAEANSDPKARPAEIGGEYTPVVAWHLGYYPSAEALPSLTAQVRQLRQADRQVGRPVICGAEENLLAFSRQIDILSASRPVAGTSLELKDYSTWLAQRMQLARPATPLWAVIETTPAPALAQQTALLAGRDVLSPAIDVDVVRLQVYQALMAGARGIEFASGSRLDSGDKLTQQRAAALALLNAELELIEPWIAAGTFAGGVTSTDPAVSGTVVDASSGRIALVARCPQGSQFVPAPSVSGTELPPLPGAAPPPPSKAAGKPDNGPALKGSKPLQHTSAGDPLNVTNSSSSAGAGGAANSPSPAIPAGPLWLTVPAIPDTSSVYELTPVDVQPILHRQVAGGTAVAIEDLPLTAALLITSDPLIVNGVRQRARELAARTARLQREISGQTLEDEAALAARLPSQASLPPVATTFSQAQADLRRADELLAAGDSARAYVAARTAAVTLGRWRHEAWQRSVKALQAPVSSPLATCFSTLPEQLGFTAAVANPAMGENLLPSGNFEDLPVMLSAGWQHFEHAPAEVQTGVELSPVAPYADRFSLRMHAASTKTPAPETIVESPPLWVISAPVGLSMGDVVCIRGQVRVLAPIRGAVDGLMIVDSLAGQPLAERFGQTDGWREFVMYRAAPQAGNLTLTFALSGLGDAWIDNVSVRLLRRGMANTQAGAVSPPAGSISAGVATANPWLAPRLALPPVATPAPAPTALRPAPWGLAPVR